MELKELMKNHGQFPKKNDKKKQIKIEILMDLEYTEKLTEKNYESELEGITEEIMKQGNPFEGQIYTVKLKNQEMKVTFI